MTGTMLNCVNCGCQVTVTDVTCPDCVAKEDPAIEVCRVLAEAFTGIEEDTADAADFKDRAGYIMKAVRMARETLGFGENHDDQG